MTVSMIEIQYPVALKVGLDSRKQARAAGAKWNSVSKQWEAPNPAALFKCSKWTHRRLGVLWHREWLDVPYSQRHRAKMFNARFDRKYNCWYDPLGSASLSAAGLNPYRLRRQSCYTSS
jgi:Domain of unknown function (DUF5710)